MMYRPLSLIAVLSLLTLRPAAAQEPTVDPATVEACFQSAAYGQVDPDCIGAASAACQSSAPGGETTVGISGCTMAETAEWDAILNREYRDTRARFADIDGIGDQLLVAQRGWIAMRDADCTIAYDRWGGGSMRSIASTHCQMNHTARRALELKHMRDN